MAKDLPYFKFFCSEWNDGDITLEDYNVQGVFINVCSYYWSKECNLESKMLYKRFKNVKEEIATLISEGHIKISEGFVEINFLNEQGSERMKQSKIKRKGGLASAEARRLKKIEHNVNTPLTEIEHVLKNSSTESQLLREDKIREEKRREEKRLSDFDIFWKTYAKPEGKKKASDKFLRLPQKDVDKILLVVKNYVSSTPDKKYRKHPTTWLNGEHWNDEITEVKKTGINRQLKANGNLRMS